MRDMSVYNKYKPNLIKYVVSKWLRSNALQMGDKLTKEQSDNMFDIYSKDCEFHSPWIRRQVGGNHFSGGFRMSVGEPKLRGTKRYVLPHMSLDFVIGRSSVYIFTDIQRYLKGCLKIKNIQKYAKWLGLAQDTSGGRYIFGTPQTGEGEMAIHPHVSTEGSPCLGDFSQPWSVCISQGNLPMLKNVAKSFINNWTRNDAYWDINHVYRSYESHKALQFKESIIFTTIAKNMTYARESASRNYRDMSNYALSRFVYSTECSKLLSLGMSLREILLHWMCASVGTDKKRDLPNRALSKSRKLFHDMIALCDRVKTDVRGKLNMGSYVRLTGILDGAMVKEFDIKYPFNTPEHTYLFLSDAWSWVRSSIENTSSELRGFENSSNSGLNITSRHIMQSKKDFKRNRWLVLKDNASIRDITYQLGFKYCGSMTRNSINHYRENIWVMALIRMANKYAQIRGDDFEFSPYSDEETRECLFNWEKLQQYCHKSYHDYLDGDQAETMNPEVPGHCQVGMLLWALIDTVRINTSLMLFGASTSARNEYKKMVAEMECDVLEGIKQQLKEKTRSVINERDKSARVAYGTRSQSGSRENQLSLETF